MKVGEFKQFVVDYYFRAHSPKFALLGLGAPGVGKSTAVKEAAREIASRLGKSFIEYDENAAEYILQSPDRWFVLVDFRLTECEPSDLIGLPRDRDGFVQYKPLLWAYILSRTSGILLLDELTNVQRPDIISAAYKLIFDRKAGFVRFSDDVLIIALGNAPEHSPVAVKLPAPLMNRTLKITVEPPTVDDWANWMSEHHQHWDAKTYAYLKRFESDLIKIPSEIETLENFPTPRTWEQVAINALPDEAVLGLLGEEVGSKYCAFRKTSVPTAEELFKNPAVFLKMSLDQQYIASVVVGEHLRKHPEDARKALAYFKLAATVHKEHIIIPLIVARECSREIVKVLIQDQDLRSALVQLGKFMYNLQ